MKLFIQLFVLIFLVNFCKAGDLYSWYVSTGGNSFTFLTSSTNKTFLAQNLSSNFYRFYFVIATNNYTSNIATNVLNRPVGKVGTITLMVK